MSTPHRVRRSIGTGLLVAGEIVGVIMQVVLVTIGYSLLWGSSVDSGTFALVSWCALASLYLGCTILWLSITVRSTHTEPGLVRTITAHPLVRFLSTVVTFGASVIGICVAIDLITSLGLEIQDSTQEISAIWAMLLSWALFNWGFARIYYSRYHRSATPPLRFPGTPNPGVVDFVYFAFTNATTFAVSDVQVRESRMRWTVVWHTTTAFFFNALIIALSMNVISNGKLFANLVS